MKCRHYILICLCMVLLGAVAWGQDDIAAALYQRALQKMESARKKQVGNELSTARGLYRQAERDLRVLQKRYPNFKTPEIAARIAACQEKRSAVEAAPQELPEGCIEISPGISRGGTRCRKGQSLVGKVKKTGDGEYEVHKYTVKIMRAGSKIGASCTCPDFQYNTFTKGEPCKHIWSVLLKEGLP